MQNIHELLEVEIVRRLKKEEQDLRRSFLFPESGSKRYRRLTIREIDRLHAAIRMLRVLEEHELPLKIEIVDTEVAVGAATNAGHSLFDRAREAFTALLTQPKPERFFLTIVLGEIEIRLPREYWEEATTKEPCS